MLSGNLHSSAHHYISKSSDYRHQYTTERHRGEGAHEMPHHRNPFETSSNSAVGMHHSTDHYKINLTLTNKTTNLRNLRSQAKEKMEMKSWVEACPQAME